MPRALMLMKLFSNLSRAQSRFPPQENNTPFLYVGESLYPIFRATLVEFINRCFETMTLSLLDSSFYDPNPSGGTKLPRRQGSWCFQKANCPCGLPEFDYYCCCRCCKLLEPVPFRTVHRNMRSDEVFQQEDMKNHSLLGIRVGLDPTGSPAPQVVVVKNVCSKSESTVRTTTRRFQSCLPSFSHLWHDIISQPVLGISHPVP